MMPKPTQPLHRADHLHTPAVAYVIRRRTYRLLMGLLVFLGVGSAIAQVTAGSLNGTVHDTTGAVVPEATVILKNEATTSDRSTTSNSSGVFSFIAVPA